MNKPRIAYISRAEQQRTRRALFAGAIIFAFAQSHVLAATYFVRASGNDSFVGTSPATAFRTITKAASVVQAGDTVYVGAGTFFGQVSPAVSGTETNPIRFVADKTGSQTGDSGTVTINTWGNLYGISCVQRNHCQFTGFRITASNQWCFNAERSTGLLMQDCTLTSTSVGGVQLQGATITIADCTIGNFSGDGVRINNHGATQSNVTIQRTTLAGCSGRPVNQLDPGTLVVQSSTVSGYNERGISIAGAGSSVTVRESQIKSGGRGVYIGVTANVTVVNCLFTGLGSPAVEIENNPNTVAAIWNCTFASLGGAGVMFKGGTGAVRNCIFTGCAGLNISGGNLAHSHNIFYQNSSHISGGTLAPTETTNQDPQFASNYQLGPTSPARESGTAGTSVTSIDLSGGARPAGPGWDIGCYEYGSVTGNNSRKVVSWTQVKPN